MVFPRPVQHRIQDIFPAHGPFAGNVVSAVGTIAPGPVLLCPVIVARHRPFQPGILPVSVIVNHIHNHTKSVPVQILYHFLAFPDTHFPVIRVRGIKPFRNPVIHRIISPVELFLRSGLIHRPEIIDGHQLNMRHPKLLQIPHAGRMNPIAVQRRVLHAKRPVGSPNLFRKSAGRIPGILPDIQFVNHILRSLFRRPVFLPAFRVRQLRAQNHTARPIGAAGPGIGIRRTRQVLPPLNFIVIIYPVQIFRKQFRPDAVFFRAHGFPAKGFRSLVPVSVQIQKNPLCPGTPQLENCLLPVAEGPQIISSIITISQR